MKRTASTVSFAMVLAAVVIGAWMLRRSKDTAEAALVERDPTQVSSTEVVERTEAAAPLAIESSSERVEAQVKLPPNPFEIALRTEGAPLAQFHGRIVYATTGQGVPWCSVGLRGVGRQVEACTTDEDGHFHSKLDYPLARTLVSVTDYRANGYDWDSALQVQRKDGDPEWRLAVKLEPTIVIAGSLPEGLEPSTVWASVSSMDGLQSIGSSVRLRRGGEYWFARGDVEEDLEVRLARASKSLASRKSQRATIDVSALSPEARARFESEGRQLEDYERWFERAAAGNDESPKPKPGPPGKVCFASHTPTWKGTALLDGLAGVVKVTPRWEPLGDVALRFHGNWEKPPSWSVSVELRSGPLDPEPISAYGQFDRLEEHPLHLSVPTPGPYTLLVRSEMCDAVEVPMTVRAGETTTIDVELNCAISAGSLRGEITSDSGESPSEHVFVGLSRPDLQLSGKINIGRDLASGKWKARFEFKDVPAGDFEVQCQAGEFGIQPSRMSARGGDFVRLRVSDRPAYIDLGFRVFDAESGDELDTFNIDCVRGMERSSLRGLRSGAIAVEHTPADGRLSWSVTSPGHLCVEGNLADQNVWGHSDSAKRWIDLRLQRGFSIRCYAFDGENNLAGVTILADGIEMGTTDANGILTLTLPTRAKSIDARYRDWQCIESDIDSLDTMESCDSFGFTFERKP